MRQYIPGTDSRVTHISYSDFESQEILEHHYLAHLHRPSHQLKRNTPSVEPEYLLADLLERYPAICHEELHQGYLEILSLLQECLDELNARYDDTTSLELELAMDQFEKELAILTKHLPPQCYKHDLQQEASKIQELVHKEVRASMAFKAQGLALFDEMDREIERLLQFLERKYRIKYIRRAQVA